MIQFSIHTLNKPSALNTLATFRATINRSMVDFLLLVLRKSPSSA